ncbi:hypothetical protein [Legionella brunensis]|uniref:Uncharacterized protein n=1 Tax=Legionella brunensis TaxID=29422 RepID=A0A0W0SML7_9GAMM|nr:hypothetical protein [Legionella brunensis]KTC84197.1 hypothetical protein Lbru_1558 [Legionella brunensis]
MTHSFFVKPSNTLFEHSTTLALYNDKKVPFNAEDPAHRKLIDDCTRTVKEKLQALQAMDVKIATSFSLGTIALGLSYILPLTLVAGGCFAYGAYQLGQRKFAYGEYTEALENLAKCCRWSLGTVRNENVLKNETINGMITTLAPLTTAQDLRDFIDDKFEDQVIEQAEDTKQNLDFLEHHLNQKEQELYFQIYGYKQGGFLNILNGIAYAIKNSFNALKSACISQEPAQPAPLH